MGASKSRGGGKALVISPFYWVDGEGVGLPTVHLTAQELSKHFEVHFVIGANSGKSRQFKYFNINVHEVSLPFSFVEEKYGFEKSIFEVTLPKLRDKVFWPVEQALWVRTITKYVRTKFQEGVELKYLFTPFGMSAGKYVSADISVWRFLGVGYRMNRERINIWDVLEKPGEYLALLADLRSLSEKERPILVITDDGTPGKDFVRVIGLKFSKIFFMVNGIPRSIFMSRWEACKLKNRLNALNKVNPSSTIVVSSSRLVSWKRVDRVIRTAAYLRDNKSVVFLVVGSGGLAERLQKLANEIGVVGSNLYFLGAVEREKLFQLLSLSDIYISFYDLAQRGNSMYEAMASGLVPVVLNTKDVDYLVVDNLTGFAVDSEEEAARIISKLSLNRKQRLRIGIASRHMCKKYVGTWDKRLEKEVAAILDSTRSGYM